mmetsp:Transcript_115056/g.330550  ORF Transcript_115056/g.330550 Transcript_115056/m.330550 type:complete len:142 (+) Transcript_115056:271-696(+)|eukprot:CAMPEP_0170306836 /NCGR_PEP_ID=MMETSP0116_2-20130129/53821_1 /TAXON_ID=400756 /ORGANISM="Durinskia baltica, Strain CSIRO CS-38" /LENGTH=141 /DNA_ID=CAMNT_0010558945 /DNA_START=218 /DNA_END=643 /DNA_ORIENTATION=-
MSLRATFLGRLTILAFPCNQFGEQEPGDRAQIQAFTQGMGVPSGDVDQGFVIMDKVDVNGPDTHPVFQYLKGSTPDASDIKWNFASYWLISPSGVVQRLTGGRNGPATFAPQVDEVLAKECANSSSTMQASAAVVSACFSM